MTKNQTQSESNIQPVITQQLLEATRESLDQKYFANKEYDRYRDEVLDLHDAGATVEQGPFYMDIRPREVRFIAQQTVLDVLGQGALDQLLSHTEKLCQRVVRIKGPYVAPHQEGEQSGHNLVKADTSGIKVTVVVEAGCGE